MYDNALFLRTLSEFTRALLTPYDVHAALEELAERVTEVLDLLGSGVSLAREGRLTFDTAKGQAVARVEMAQDELQSGPCVTAYQTGKVLAIPDVQAHRDRWPEYCDAAAELGLHAVASVPLKLGELSAGALNLYARGRRTWETEDLEAAQVMADMATAYLINSSHHRQQVELNAQLQHALESRVIIEQAKGMIAKQRGVGPEKAFDLLRRHARNRNATVHAVAEAVVNLGLEV